MSDCFNPLVSVIIPTYKRDLPMVSRAINSVINQTYKNIEIIIIDDSPADYINRSRISDFINKINLNHLFYYQNKQNIGGSLSRNEGIKYSKGDFITFLDDDDEYLPYKIEKQVRFMINNNLDLSFSKLVMYNNSGNVVDYRSFDDIESFDNEYLLKYHLKKHMTGTPTFMFKADKLKLIGGFDDAKMGQEFYLMLKAIENNLSIGYLPECDIKVYKHSEGSISFGKNKIIGEEALFEFKKKYFNLLNHEDINFIKFRHWAVMVVAYKRNNMYFSAFSASIKAFISSPRIFVKQVSSFIYKIVKLNMKE